MSPFIEGVIAASTTLGGLCGFIYWVFGIMEKRLEIKIVNLESRIDAIANDVHNIALELREERRSKDALYKFVLDNYRGSD